MIKKFFKYLFICGVSFTLALCVLLSLSCTQKFILQCVLFCFFPKTQITGYKGGLKGIQIESLQCQKQNFEFKLENLKLEWKPMDFILGRGLHLPVLQGQIDFHVKPHTANKQILAKAGFEFPNFSKSKWKGPLKYLQLPIKLSIDHCLWTVQGTYKNFVLENGQFQLDQLNPGQTAKSDYKVQVKLTDDTPISQIILEGQLQLTTDPKGKFTHLRTQNKVRMKRQSHILPLLTVEASSETIHNRQTEHVQLNVHYGLSNDLQIVGDFFEKGDKFLNMQWKCMCDHSIARAFYTHSAPIVSLNTNGELSLYRNAQMEVRNDLRVWCQHLERLGTQLSGLPPLSLTATTYFIMAPKKITFKQCDVVLKQKDTDKTFLAGNLVQRISFEPKTNTFSAEAGEKLLELNIKDFPCELLNSYLQMYGYQLKGQCAQGTLELSQSKKTSHYSLYAINPIRFSKLNLWKEQSSLFKDLNLWVLPHIKIDGPGKQGAYTLDLQVLNESKQQLCSINQLGELDFSQGKNYKIHTQGEGQVSSILFSQPIFAEKLQKPLPEELLFKATYDFDYQTAQAQFSFKNLSCNLQNYQNKFTHLDLHLNQAISLSCQDVKQGKWPVLKDSIMTISLFKVPLDYLNLFQDKGKVGGELSWAGEVLAQDKSCLLQSKQDFLLESLNYGHTYPSGSYKEDIRFEKIKLLPSLSCQEDSTYVLQLKNIAVHTTADSEPTLQGNLSAQCNLKGSVASLEQTDGAVDFKLDDFNLQTCLQDLPMLLGDGHAQWKYADKKIESNYRVHLAPQEAGGTLDLQGIAHSAEKDPNIIQIQGPVELHCDQRLSDFQLDLACKPCSKFNLQGDIKSREFYIEDLKEMGLFFKDFGVKCQQKWLSMTSAEYSKPTAENTTQKSLSPSERSPVQSLEGNFNYTHVPQSLTFKANCHPFLGQVSAQGSVVKKEDRYQIESTLLGKDMSLAHLLPLIKPTITRENSPVSGRFDMKANIHVNTDFEHFSPNDVQGNCQIEGRGGELHFLSSDSTPMKAVNGLTNTVGLLLGGKISEMSTLGFLLSYCQGIPFEKASISLQREADKPICLNKSYVYNNDFALYAEGSIALDPEKDFQKQAIDFNFQLNGKQGPFMKYFPFDDKQTDEFDFNLGPTFHLTGTLRSPNYKDLLHLLNYKKEDKQEEVVPKKEQSPLDIFQNVLNLF